LYRKPVNTDIISRAVDKLYALGIRVIVNIMLGLPGESRRSYQRTWDFLNDNQMKFYALNIYTFAAYEDANLDIVANQSDKDELYEHRSFWTPEEAREYAAWSPVFYSLGIDIVKRRKNG